MQFKSLATRIWLPALLTTLVIAGATAVTAWVSNEQTAVAHAEHTARQQRLDQATQWMTLTMVNTTRNLGAMLSTDATLATVLKPDIEQTSARISELQKSIDAAVTAPEERALLKTVADRRAAVLTMRKQLLADKANGPLQPEAVASYRALTVDYVKAQQAYVDAQKQAIAKGIETDRSLRENNLLVIAGVLAALCGLQLVMAHFTVRAVLPPIREAVLASERIAGGDLSVEVRTDRVDEIGELMQGLRHMTESLGSLIAEVRNGASNIQVASAEIATGNADLSSRTEQTASSLQQTASSMEQLTDTVRQSAEAAAQANQLASSAASAAERGGEVVGQVVSNMDDIATSSRKIADIIGVIDGIAFQTNILALNAAVEAARAGEQGRGFAVVAGEVRSLAQRSADAAKEIKGLIGASVEKVESGSRLVQDAGTTMSEIVASVRRVSDIVGEITAGTAEQRDGIGQVNTAVSQLDQMTQQNAALVEESAAAADSMRQQAQRLADMVSTFSLGDRGRVAPPPKAAAPSFKPAAVAPKPAAHEQMAKRVIQTARAAPIAPAAPVAVASAAPSDDWESF
jgi:methyl-accepting chemotaxis protein